MAALAGGKARRARRPLALHHGRPSRPIRRAARPFRTALPAETPSGGRRACSPAGSARSRARALPRPRGSRRPARGARTARSRALLRRHFAPRENDVERPAPSDDARQPHRAAVDQRHAPAPAVNAHVGALLHHADVAPERELHAAGDRRPRHRGDHGLRRVQPLGPIGPRGTGPSPSGKSSAAIGSFRPTMEAAYLRSKPAQNAPPAPHSTATDWPGSRSNSSKAAVSASALPVHGVARLDTVADQGRDRSVALDMQCHCSPPVAPHQPKLIAYRRNPFKGRNGSSIRNVGMRST